MAGDYLSYLHTYGNRSGSLLVNNTSVVPVTLLAARNTNWSIKLQYIKVKISSPGFAGSLWQFVDSAGNPITPPIPTDQQSIGINPTQAFDFDFGPEGIALAPGADFIFNFMASDAHGSVTWGAYNKLTTVVDIVSNKE